MWEHRKISTPNEPRTDGTFEGIECSAGRITLLVRPDEGLERFSAPGMDAIDLITYRTYRDDTDRSIGCGPRPQPERVTVTWRAVARDAVRRAVAVELFHTHGDHTGAPVQRLSLGSEPM